MRVPTPAGAYLAVLKVEQTFFKGLRTLVNPMARAQIDIALLFTTRITRLFAYGFLSVVLALYLEQVGLSEQAIGVLLTLTLIGDAGISLWMTTSADRIGRRRMLVLGAALMIVAGVVFISTGNPLVLTIAAILGVISLVETKLAPSCPSNKPRSPNSCHTNGARGYLPGITLSAHLRRPQAR